MDSLSVYSLVYSLIFKLSVIGAGVLTIFFGYRLLSDGLKENNSRSDVSAEAGPLRFMLKNTGVGGLFALFGAFLISVTVLNSSPEVMIEGRPILLSVEEKPVEDINRVVVKGSEGSSGSRLDDFERLYKEAYRIEQSGAIEAALSKYSRTLSIPGLSMREAAKSFNAIALIYRMQDRLDEAAVLARLAVFSEKRSAKYLDTLALVLLDKKEYEESLRAAIAAVKIDPAYGKTLDMVKSVKRGDEW